MGLVGGGDEFLRKNLVCFAVALLLDCILIEVYTYDT